jgi:uncharacterized protein (TIGR02246 family)
MRPFLALPVVLAFALASVAARAAEPPTATAAAAEAPQPPAARSVETTLTGEAAADVAEVERAFAKTMADRDLEAFASFLHPDTVWFSGPGGSALHGREAVVAAWAKFYEGDAAPFSWAPDRVAVMEGGRLAMSMGPVFDPQGRQIARFTSVWQRGEDGRWLILFDKGEANPPSE